MPVRKKLPIEYIREILTNRIEFVKPSEEENADKTTQSCDAKELQTRCVLILFYPVNKQFL